MMRSMDFELAPEELRPELTFGQRFLCLIKGQSNKLFRAVVTGLHDHCCCIFARAGSKVVFKRKDRKC